MPSIDSVGLIGGPIRPVEPTTLRQPVSTDATGSTDFAGALTDAVGQLDTSLRRTDELSRAAATGALERPEDLMVAAAESQLTTQITVALRNRAVEAFNEIMRMQI